MSSSGSQSESWADRAKQNTAEALHSARQHVQGESLTDQAKDKFHEGGKKVGAEEPSLIEKAKGKVEQGYETLKEKGEQVKESITRQGEQAKESVEEAGSRREEPQSWTETAKQRTGETLGHAEEKLHHQDLTGEARETATRENDPESLIEKAGRKIGEAIKGAGDFVQHKTSTGQ